MGYFPVRYDSRVVIYEHKMFIRLATGILGIGRYMLNTRFTKISTKYDNNNNSYF